MLKWLIKFALEIAPPVAATVIGAFVVHQLWPAQHPEVSPPATPPAAQSSADPAATVGANNDNQPAPVAVTSPPLPPSKPARQSSEVAKSQPPAPRGETAAAVLERAERALATIPPSKPAASSNSVAVGVPSPVATTPPVPPPTVSSGATMAVTANSAAATSAAPPPMEPPREIAAPAPTTASTAPVIPVRPEVRTTDRSPLRVYHRDRANLAEIPNVDPGQPPASDAAATPAEPNPASPPREKNIVEHIFGGIQSVLPERLRGTPN